MTYVCVLCKSTNGTPVKKDGKPTGDENWWWYANDHGVRTAGPFCSQTCVGSFQKSNPEERLRVLFGGDIVNNLKRVKQNALGLTEDGVYALRWDRMFTCRFPEKLDNDRDFGQVKGVSPFADASNRLTLDDIEPAEYWVEVEWEMV